MLWRRYLALMSHFRLFKAPQSLASLIITFSLEESVCGVRTSFREPDYVFCSHKTNVTFTIQAINFVHPLPFLRLDTNMFVSRKQKQ